MSRNASAAPRPQEQTQDRRTVGGEVRTALELLPELLHHAPLANGVVEVVVEDVRAPWRRLFDIHDGRIVPAELGSVAPWASIAGGELAWRLALGPDGDVSLLRHTGDHHLAERVLAAIARSRNERVRDAAPV